MDGVGEVVMRVCEVEVKWGEQRTDLTVADQAPRGRGPAHAESGGGLLTISSSGFALRVALKTFVGEIAGYKQQDGKRISPKWTVQTEYEEA